MTQYKSFTTQKQKIATLEQDANKLELDVKNREKYDLILDASSFNKNYMTFTCNMRFSYREYEDWNFSNVLILAQFGGFYATIKFENGNDFLASAITCASYIKEFDGNNTAQWLLQEQSVFKLWYNFGTTYIYTVVVPHNNRTYLADTDYYAERSAELQIVYQNNRIYEHT